jgi:UDP-glucose 4-epimerase
MATASNIKAKGTAPNAKSGRRLKKSSPPKPKAPAVIKYRSQQGRDDRAVVITGISGNLGRELAKHLHKSERIIGIDRRPFPGKPKDIEHHRLDLRRNRTEAIFRAGEVKAVLHIGIMHNPREKTREHHSWNIMGTTRLLEYVTRYKIPRVVVLSSANVYGPSPANDTYLSEEAPLMGSLNFSEARDLVELDMLAQSFFWKHPDVDTIILRPVHIVGRYIKNAPSNYLRLNPAPVVMGFDPMVQLIHDSDAVRAMAICVEREHIRGVFNVAGPQAAPLSAILRYLKRDLIQLPSFILRGGVDLLWRLKLTEFPPPEIDHIHHVCMVDGSRFAAETGFQPVYQLPEILDRLKN